MLQIQLLKDYFAVSEDVVLAYLFGSHARGRASSLSDVDVAVLLRDGLLLHCASEDTRIMYTAETVVRYLDFEPVLKRYERAILERARQGELLHGHNPYRGALERYRQLRERLKGTTGVDI